MKSFVQEGDILDFVAPSGGVTSGVGVMIGGIFAVAAVTAAEGETFAGAVRGVFDLAAEGAVSGQDFDGNGEVCYWDATNKRVTKTATGNKPIGFVIAAKATAATEARVFVIQRISETAAGVTALTGTLTGTVNGALVDVAADVGACAGGSTPTATQVDAAIAKAVATIVSGVNEQNKEMLTKINAIINS